MLHNKLNFLIIIDYHSHRFNKYHYKLSLFICIFGVVTNILNFIVLTRKTLKTEINTILATLAVSDGLVMLVYVPYAFDYAFNLNTSDERFTYGYALYLYVHATLTQTFHTISIFLTIVLAFYRYVCICRNSLKKILLKKSNHLMLIACCMALLASIPLFLSLEINKQPVKSSEGVTYYLLGSSEFTRHHEKVFIWIYSVIIKLIPCIVLTFFSIKLVQVLLRVKRNIARNGIGSLHMSQRRRSQTDHTTIMLLAVLILFLITEFPQGIFGLLSAVLHRNFFVDCYQRLGKLTNVQDCRMKQNVIHFSTLGGLFDFLALLNSSVNFILYCLMSKRFREVFIELFVRKLSPFKRVQHHDNDIEMQTQLNQHNIHDDTTQNLDSTQNVTLSS